jgi:hypothetical protein
MSADSMAEIQLNMRPGWHQLGKKDEERILKAIDEYLQSVLDKL